MGIFRQVFFLVVLTIKDGWIDNFIGFKIFRQA